MRDRYNREIDYLRISITDRCNLRCIYCMEEEAEDFFSSKNIITDDEIIRIVKVLAKLGIKKVRITGGEPLVRPGIEEIISRINNVYGIEEIYITTNGMLLHNKVKILKEIGLKGVNISLDSLKEENFNKITRVGSLKNVITAIDECIHYGVKVKLNTVMVNDINKDEIIDFVKFTVDKPIDVRFIELMPIGIGKRYRGVSNEEILGVIQREFSNIEILDREGNSGPAKYVKVIGAAGKVGFISAMSNCFCQDCNRIRITADGFIKRCLHFNYGEDLKSLLREGISDEELTNIIKNNIYNKPEKHLFNKNDSHEELRFMNKIGG